MQYKDIRKKAKESVRPPKPKDPPSSCSSDKPPIQKQQRVRTNIARSLKDDVVAEYNGLKSFYDDIENPDNIVPNRAEILKSLNNLLLAEEKVKFNTMVDSYEKKIDSYKIVIESLIRITEILLNINSSTTN